MSRTVENIKQDFDSFIASCELIKDSYPYAVVLMMHEFYRNLYPTDPYIAHDKNIHQLDKCDDLLSLFKEYISNTSKFGAYNIDLDKYTYTTHDDVKENTADVYGELWENYPQDIIDEAVSIIEERFNAADISLNVIKNKVVLDAGCGSGRYSCALAKLGAKHVVGVDFGDRGLRLAAKLAAGHKISNVSFQKGNLLNMPFENDMFDFVFSNGVCHHTGDTEKATSEIYRVLRYNAHAWFYIYGDGGLFWHARKKMNQFMKCIPQEYSMRVLDMIGMPKNRFIFADNWYVPIEHHMSNSLCEQMLTRIGFSNFRRVVHGRATDFDFLSVHGSAKDQDMWGDGENRFFLTK